MSNHQDLKLGQLIPPGANVVRDAIHIAVAPVVAGEKLKPGAIVHLSKDGIAFNYGKNAPDVSPGIVDPFLDCLYVHKGERFWLYLFPNTITGLTHTWSHPAFPDTAPTWQEKANAKSILGEYACQFGMSIGNFVDSILREYTNNSDDGYITVHTGDYEGGISIAGDDKRFWDAFAAYTGKRLEGIEIGYRCAC